MQDVNALIVFSSRHGRAEKLALAAGVGAIQARANIRLRRLADLADAEEIAQDAVWTGQLARMMRDYVEPRPADPTWADVLILATSGASTAELERYLVSLPALGPMAGKVAAVLVVEHDLQRGGQPEAPGTARATIEGAASAAGLSVEPAPPPPSGDAGDPIAQARAYGQQVVGAVRARKGSM